MLSPKEGNALAPVPPDDPDEALAADVADPGEVARVKSEQRASKKGKYGTVQVSPHKPPATDEEKSEKKSWIEIRLRTKNGAPVPGEPYEITMPDGTVAPGTLDPKGMARHEGMEPGTCKVRFPKRDGTSWRKA